MLWLNKLCCCTNSKLWILNLHKQKGSLNPKSNIKNSLQFIIILILVTVVTSILYLSFKRFIIWFEGNKLSHPSMLVTYCFQSSLCLCFKVTGALLSVSILPWYWRHEKWSFTVLPINSFCWEWMFKTAPISWITSFTQWSFMRSFCVFVCKV